MLCQFFIPKIKSTNCQTEVNANKKHMKMIENGHVPIFACVFYRKNILKTLLFCLDTARTAPVSREIKSYGLAKVILCHFGDLLLQL